MAVGHRPHEGLLRLDSHRGGLSKFDYGDPAIDRWGWGFGMGGSGYGAGGGYFGQRGAGAAGISSRGAASAVLAADRTVPIPRLGVAVLFQSLLLPADAPSVLTLRARRDLGARP